MDQEQISFEIDERPAVAAASKINAAMDASEKKITSTMGSASKAAERMGETVVRVSDRSRSSIERLVASVERQAQAYGKTGVDRLISQRDQLIQRLGNEKSAVDRVISSYEKMFAAERKGSGESGFNARYAFFGAKDLLEGRYKFATAELANELINLGGKALVIGGVVGAIAGIGYAAVEVRKKLRELAEAPEVIAAKFSRLNDATRTANDELRVSNDRLTSAIAKIEHRPENGLKLAMDEAALAADHLAERMDKGLHSFLELTQKTQVGFFGRYLMGHAGTEDIQKLVGGQTGFGGLIGELYKTTSAGQDPTAVLSKYRDQVQKQLEAAQRTQKQQGQEAVQTDALVRKFAFQAGVPILTSPKNPGYVDPRQQERIETLQALLRQINSLSESYGLEKQNTALTGRKNQLDAQREQMRSADEQRKRFQTEAAAFTKRGDESELSAIAKIYYERDLLLKQAAKLKGVEADISAVRKSADQQAGTILKKSRDEFEAYERKRRQATLNENARSSFHQMLIGGPSPEQLRDFQRGFAAQDQVQAIEMQSQRDTLNRNARRAQQIVGLSGATGIDAIRAAYTIRIDLAKQLATVEAQRIAKEEDSAKRMVEIAQAQRDFQKETAEAQQEALLKQLELQKQQFDSIKQQSADLFHTLFTRPGDFGRQLGSTVREAALRPVTEGLSNMTASALQPLIYGKNGNGGIAGTLHGLFNRGNDPIKIATDLNSTVTAQNTAAISALTSTIMAARGAVGPSSMAAPLPTGSFGGGVSLPAIAPRSTGGLFGLIIGGRGGQSGISGGGSLTPDVQSTIRYAGQPGFGGSGGGNFPTFASDYGPFGGVGPGGTPGFAPGPLGIGIPGAPTGPGGLLKSLGGFSNFGSLIGYQGGGIWKSGSTLYGASGSGFGGPLTFGHVASSVASSPLAGTAGMLLATNGLFGSHAGTWGGIAEGTAGGALVGMQYSGPIGAAIGAAAGFGIGLGEKLAGVESPENEAKRLVQQLYRVTINNDLARQIVALAKQTYGGQVSIAVRSPEVRQMLGLYAAGTGQNMPLSSTVPHAGSLVESGGALAQTASYLYGRAYSYQSGLPTAGGYATGSYPAPGPMSLSISIAGKGAGDFLAGNVVTPDYVQSQWSSAASASNGRLANSATIQQPGLYVS